MFRSSFFCRTTNSCLLATAHRAHVGPFRFYNSSSGNHFSTTTTALLFPRSQPHSSPLSPCANYKVTTAATTRSSSGVGIIRKTPVLFAKKAIMPHHRVVKKKPPPQQPIANNKKKKRLEEDHSQAAKLSPLPMPEGVVTWSGAIAHPPSTTANTEDLKLTTTDCPEEVKTTTTPTSKKEKGHQLQLLGYVMTLLTRALMAWETKAVKDMISSRRKKKVAGKRGKSSSKAEGCCAAFPPFKKGVLDFARGLLEDDLTLLVLGIKVKDKELRNRIEDVKEVYDTYVQSPICLINTVYSMCEQIVPEERPNILDFLEENYFRKMDINTSFDEVHKVMQMSLGVCLSFIEGQFAKFLEEKIKDVESALLSPHRCKGLSLAALSKKLKKKKMPQHLTGPDTEENRKLYPDDSRIRFLESTTSNSSDSVQKKVGRPCDATLI